MTFSITCSCNQLHDHTYCTLLAHFAHMHVLTCAGTHTCAIFSLQAAVLFHCSLLICIMQENNFACFYMFSLFGQPLNNVSTSRNFNPAADCWAVRRPLPADYGRPWCIRLAHISAIACTASVKDCCNWDHTAYTVKEMFGPRTPLTWQVQCERLTVPKAHWVVTDCIHTTKQVAGIKACTFDRPREYCVFDCRTFYVCAAIRCNVRCALC